MGDNLHRSFALLIAHVLPGLILVFALASHVPTLQLWLGSVATANVTIGSMLMVVMASVFLSMVLNGGRFLVYECVLKIEQKINAPDVNEAARQFAPIEAALERLVQNHYVYYQFYGAASLAWPVAMVLWSDQPMSWLLKLTLLIAGIAIEYILCVSAWDAMKRFLKKRSTIVQMPTQRSA